MKKYIIIISFFLFCSCASKKTHFLKNEKTISEAVTTKKDSIKTKEVSRKIEDNFSVSLRTNNKLVDSILKERLKGFVSKKTSGTNSYSAKFNYDKMVLDIATLVGETQNTNTETSTDILSEKTISETTDEYIKEVKKRIPFWVYIIAIIYFLPSIIEKIQFIINPLYGILKK